MVIEELRQHAFRTQRLAMRCLTMKDDTLIFDQQNNLTVMKYVNPRVKDPQPSSLEAVRKGLDTRIANNHLHLLIYLLPEDQHIQTPTGRSPYDPELRFPSITPESIAGTPVGNCGMLKDYKIGYMVAHEYWGRGYASEAIAGMLREIWRLAAEGMLGKLPRDDGESEYKGKEYVQAMTHPENKASGRVLEKAGAVNLGVKELDDWAQTAEDRQRDGVKKLTMQTYRAYKPEPKQ